MSDDETISAREILDVLAREIPECPAYCEHSGGGCATIYVGTPDERGFYWLSVGPGRYDWKEPDASSFDFSDLYVGPDEQYTSDDFQIVTDVEELRRALVHYRERVR